MSDFSNEIWAYALRNSIDFGKVDAGRILPKLFQHGLDKNDIKKIMPKIQEIVKQINSLSKEKREKEFEKYSKYVMEHEQRQEGELPELENAVSGKVVTRLAPEPSKYNHIGHALVFLIQYLYAKKYNGKCILRFDDTNPEKSTKEFYDAMKEDLAWLGIKWDKELLASNDMKKMYEYAETLIKQGNAFTCSCDQETVKKLREQMKECPCRKKSSKDTLAEWKNMLDGKFKEGERTLRLKGDMKSDNGVMRDPVIFRISFAPHFIQKDKYCIWPMYDFENPVEDASEGVTHVIRSNEFEIRAELQEKILDLLKLKMPFVREIGRYQITGAETQGRVIREMIENGEVEGWDDPRLVTVKALRRRGFVPEMFQQMAKTVGLSKSGGHINRTVMESINRSIIDPIAERYSFVEDPVEIKVKDAPLIPDLEVPMHPSKPNELRIRKVSKGVVFISKKDFEEFKGKEIRLLHLYNIKLDKKNKSAVFTSKENKDIPKINWVPADHSEVKIKMGDASWISGVAEGIFENVKIGNIIQFERFGFARLDKESKNKYEFWFAHQ